MVLKYGTNQEHKNENTECTDEVFNKNTGWTKFDMYKITQDQI